MKRRIFPGMLQPSVAGKGVEAFKQANRQATVFRSGHDRVVLIDLVVSRGIVERVSSVDDGYGCAARFCAFLQLELGVLGRVRND